MTVEKCKILPKYQVTLPKDLRNKLNLNIGDRLVLVETTEGILMKKLTDDIIESIIKKQ